MKRIWLDVDKKGYKQWAELMAKANLHTNERLEYTIGIYDDEQLIATGSYDENIIKCVAVCKDYQAENLLTQVVTHLLEKMRENEQLHVFLYTKPQSKAIFHSLGFKKIVANEDVLFMELGKPNFSDYLRFLLEKKKIGEGSGIVMNANPFTKGHQYLVETAAQHSQQVYVFVLSEDHSTFSTADRLAMVRQGVAHLGNVTVIPTDQYMVSSATFPAYFLKDKAELDIAKVQATLDARLFMERIAPLLEIRTRFVGDEPFSKVTEVYNQAMQEVFDDRLHLVILPRLTIDGEAISATKVRQAIKEKNEDVLLKFLTKTTYDFIKYTN
jgi:[citrate (pro-3S)-lyase] ligase